ncbi:MAG: hypothetical protein E7490_08200 [Ruminococcaceae bacterium]|nr:hypothetical protein [Oscillospiraceae bacterium]
MSFYNLSGQIMQDDDGTSYIFSDVFSVVPANGEDPFVCNWGDVDSIRIGDSIITVNVGDRSFVVRPEYFENRKQFLSAKAIASSCASREGVTVHNAVELLPEKSLYVDYDIPDFAVFTKGQYNTKEIKSSLLLLLIGKTARILWTVGILGGIAALIFFHLLIGFDELNWWYLAIGSFFCGVGAVAVTYLIMLVISRIKYAGILKQYSKYDDTVTFAVCDEGFSACESDIYGTCNIIKWNNRDTYMETGSMFIVLRRGKPILWIPKNLLASHQYTKIQEIFAVNLSEK